MLARYSVIILLIINLSVSYASMPNQNSERENNLCETQISIISSVLQTEIFRKLDDMDRKMSNNIEDMNRKLDALKKKIPDMFDELKNKLNVLEKINHDLEEDNREKFHKVEKNILDNLEEYIDGKLDSSDKHMNRKIDELEKIIPDKIDINVLSRKLDALRNNELNLCYNVRTKPEPLSNLTERNITESENTATYFGFDALNKTITNLEENFNFKLTELKQMIPDLGENITKKLFELNTTQKHPEENNLSCNKVVVVHYNEYKPLLRMDNQTLKHVTFRDDSDGLTYFEMHLAIKATRTGQAIIRLSSVPNPRPDDTYIEIDIGSSSNSWTHFHFGGKNIKETNTPSILSATQFTAFYVKIDKDTLEFGKEHNSSPILTYSDPLLKKIKYFSFSTYVADGVTFLYDCPPNVEMLASNTLL